VTFTHQVENPQICAIEIIPQSAVEPASAAPAAGAKVIRIRAGSSEPVKDADGNVWMGEQGFEAA